MCSADNGLGQVNKAELSLDVLYAPVATLPPKREVKEGENVEIECKIASNPRPATIQVRNCKRYTKDLQRATRLFIRPDTWDGCTTILLGLLMMGNCPNLSQHKLLSDQLDHPIYICCLSAKSSHQNLD